MRASHLVNALVAAVVMAVVIFSGPSDGRAFELVNASGALTLSNSKEGVAILGGSNLRPGQRSAGSVTIGNPGATTSAIALEVGAEAETVGTGGGRLWQRMWISVADANGVIYEGRVADLGRLGLGALASGSERSFTLTAWMPSGADDNAFQGATLALRFTWLAEADAAPGPDHDGRADGDTRPAERARRRRAGADAADGLRPEPDGHRRAALHAAVGEDVPLQAPAQGARAGQARREGQVGPRLRQQPAQELVQGREGHHQPPRPAARHRSRKGARDAVQRPQAHAQAHVPDLRQVVATAR